MKRGDSKKEERKVRPRENGTKETRHKKGAREKHKEKERKERKKRRKKEKEERKKKRKERKETRNTMVNRNLSVKFDIEPCNGLHPGRDIQGEKPLSSENEFKAARKYY